MKEERGGAHVDKHSFTLHLTWIRINFSDAQLAFHWGENERGERIEIDSLCPFYCIFIPVSRQYLEILASEWIWLRNGWITIINVQMQVIYTGAILEVCMRKLVFYPEIVGFIEEEKDKFPSVKVQYAYNSPPKLIMLDDDGETKETIRYSLFISTYLVLQARYCAVNYWKF